VFLGPDEPDFTPAPVGLDFGAAVSRSQLSLAPGLKQPFFIGDGRTETGQVQVIFVPEGASRLFLGVCDGCGWCNNPGEFTVYVEMMITPL